MLPTGASVKHKEHSTMRSFLELEFYLSIEVFMYVCIYIYICNTNSIISQDYPVKMSTISKHFGLKYKEESYIFKELEKVRKETKKEFLRIKEKLAAKPAVDEIPLPWPPPPARPGMRRRKRFPRRIPSNQQAPSG